MNLLDKVVAALGGLLAVCIVVSVGASLVRDALPGLIVILGLILLYRFLWRGGLR